MPRNHVPRHLVDRLRQTQAAAEADPQNQSFQNELIEEQAKLKDFKLQRRRTREALKVGRIEQATDVNERHTPGKSLASLDRLDGDGILKLSPALGKCVQLYHVSPHR